MNILDQLKRDMDQNFVDPIDYLNNILDVQDVWNPEFGYSAFDQTDDWFQLDIECVKNTRFFGDIARYLYYASIDEMLPKTLKPRVRYNICVIYICYLRKHIIITFGYEDVFKKLISYIEKLTNKDVDFIGFKDKYWMVDEKDGNIGIKYMKKFIKRKEPKIEDEFDPSNIKTMFFDMLNNDL